MKKNVWLGVCAGLFTIGLAVTILLGTAGWQESDSAVIWPIGNSPVNG
ncbi:hypothetical protein OS242_05285 [Tumebacillus sp. DT12]|uniref:Uncharacterized protein n=1 Tax=Tumebacillus lacus TaxID=2995335 RepID=A0ABT3WYT7_9BACL|nr:hypothetical protein [Tumebacillus lacus]MCX7569366.1 hypothetical protein [Tumebacillus lacus]